MLRALFTSITLTITLLIASFGVCTQAMMPGTDMTGMSGMAQLQVHTDAMDCMSTEAGCPTSLDQHFSFLSSLLPGSGQEWMGALLLLAISIPLVTWLFSEALKWLAFVAVVYRTRLRRLLQPCVHWFSLPTFTFAFSQGILNTKRYSA